MGSPRANRIPERIKELLAELVPDLKDPRIGFVTITDVRTTPDFGHATVYYTVLGTPATGPVGADPTQPGSHDRSTEAILDDAGREEQARRETAAGLASATPLLRRELGRRLRLRQTPSLEFTHDPLPEQGRRIEQLIEQARRDT